MGNIEVRCVIVGMIQTNCYIVFDKDLKEAIVIDPGDSASYIEQTALKEGLKIKAILLTHAHGDHFKALEELKKSLDVPVYLHEDDAYRLKFQGGFVQASYDLRPDDVLLKDEDHISIGNMEIDVIHTPGHTEGGTCYYLKDEGVLFSGDTVFRHSWGRTDFEGGNEAQLFRSIREKILPLPEETIVLPGHEDPTTIKEERIVHRYNNN